MAICEECIHYKLCEADNATTDDNEPCQFFEKTRSTGKWKAKTFHHCYCTNCDFTFDIMKCDFMGDMNFCPKCGASMLKEGETE